MDKNKIIDKQKTQDLVKEAYGKVAKQQDGCGCGCSCSDAEQFALSLGYSKQELDDIPDEANLALSCGNPVLIAMLSEGEIVLDLGSGAGFDCFIAASKVGKTGKVIGLDMTQEMIDKAKENALKKSIKNVEFVLGEIEDIPLKDDSVDVVISNCVINLSYDKGMVFREIFRVLKKDGRVAISDIVLKKELPQELKEDKGLYASCISGAVLIDDFKDLAEKSGLRDVKITVKGSAACIEPSINTFVNEDDKKITARIDDYAVSVLLEGSK